MDIGRKANRMKMKFTSYLLLFFLSLISLSVFIRCEGNRATDSPVDEYNSGESVDSLDSVKSKTDDTHIQSLESRFSHDQHSLVEGIDCKTCHNSVGPKKQKTNVCQQCHPNK